MLLVVYYVRNQHGKMQGLLASFNRWQVLYDLNLTTALTLIYPA